CWPTEKVTTGDDEEYEVSQAKTGKHLSLESESNNVGLILADGASIILNYNPDAPAIDVGDKVKWTEGLPKYTTTVTGAIDFVMDVNGGKSPNSEKEGSKRDIRSFKSAKFSKGGPDCSKYANSIEISGVGCVVDKGSVSSWESAVNGCQSGGMELPDIETLRLIYDSHADGLGLSTSHYYWSSTERKPQGYMVAPDAWQKVFDNGHELATDKRSSYGYYLCVGN
ncbi:hypothetical protein J6P92_00440, partial [bacterium]|nr:hypothetical protein [bacterium]